MVVLMSLHAQSQQVPVAPRAAQKIMFPSTERWDALGLRVQGQDFYPSEVRLADTCNCGPQNFQTRGNIGIAVSYYANTGSRLAYSFDLGFSAGRIGTKSVPTFLSLKDRFTTFRGDVYYNMGPINQPITPYLHAGLHAQFSIFHASIPTGVGIRYASPKSPVMLTGEMNYGWGISNELRNNLILGVGMYVRLKGSRGPRASRALQGSGEEAAACMACLDSDFDRVPDGSDKCPKVPGSPANSGCPICDTDGDGVVDEKDECPLVAGPIDSKGCPVRIIRDTTQVAVVAPPAISLPLDFPTIHFRSGSTVLDDNALGLAKQMAVLMRNRPSDRFVVLGYSKQTKVDQKVSLDEVMSVINYLVEKEGIRPDRLIPKAGLSGGKPNQVLVRVAQPEE